jgi:prepilin-type N-terminal cleavage/methylation domain-containing protein/prepilin-type processing-associated H-X9-DG protein
MNQMSKHRRVRGFTLIEILVVVAIIALLVSILLPSLARAREQAKATMCATQFDQIFKAMFLYTSENKDVLPHLGYRPDTERVRWMWPTQTARYLALNWPIYRCPSDETPKDLDIAVENQRVWIPNSSEAVPTTKLDVSYFGACDTLSDDNTWLLTAPGLPSPASVGPMPLQITRFDRPAMNIALVEGPVPGASQECIRYVNLAEFQPNASSSIITAMQKFFRHNKRSNLLFLDGHTSRHDREDVADHIAYQQEYNPAL